MAEQKIVTVAARVPVHYNGVTYAKGVKFAMQEADVERHTDNKLVWELDEPHEESVEVTEVKSDASMEELFEAWQLDIAPHEYLLQFPEGPEAELARRIVEAINASPA